ncbi:DUF4982 domain-containing protein [Lutimonas saemankumensis]|uniref:sugar-binding domain-containing protein n=1 Tax=Lutimonas saemankumensis TaxID=483016 RepID=UPI001CD33611|nr:sugar-binding domain-containing protein [Lutimonas saemankumensis]MCA0932474.1 DUF4982 domain-containing protein [Lutimonas saemankumensis]
MQNMIRNKKILTLFGSLFILIISLQFINSEDRNATSLRQKESIDFDWKFHLGDIEGAETEFFDDSNWRSLDLPHDWSIEGNYDQNNPSGIHGGFLPTGIGWYRKDLVIESLSPDERYFIEFDGVYMNSDVYINGKLLGNRPYGYISFSYNLTPYLKPGKNQIAVRVNNSKSPSARWYTGSGIYRHVWLTKTSDIYIPQWGTYVTTSNISKSKARVTLKGKLVFETSKEYQLEILSTITDPGNNVVATSKSTNPDLKDGVFLQEFIVKNPDLWSPENPAMYNLVTNVYEKNELKDSYTTPFGIRSIELKAGKGFYLNNEPTKFKGLSNHHDAGPVGSAVPDDVLYKRLKLLKDMGCNAVRTTHNPFSPEFYKICDTLGIMVMNEAFDGWWKTKATFDYGLYFNEWWKTDLKDFIKRDRNHPSVVIWSIGNEIHGFTSDEQEEILSFAKKIDNTRPFTQGRGYSAPHIDIAGFNGHGEYKGSLESYHKLHPDKLIIGTEMTHTLQTRGVYRTKTWYRTKDNPAPWEKPGQFKKMEPKVYKIPDLSEEEVFPGIPKKYQSSYDNSIVRIGVRHDWNRVQKYDYYIGNFRWTGFDYLGESFGWPARTANFGIIDLAGFPKDHYYLYQSLWSDKPMVHLLPHWTHPGKEGKIIPVVAYTNCETAELFLNDKSLGEQEMGEGRQLVWNVPYQKGELKVVAKNDGQIVCEKKFVTAEEEHALAVDIDRKEVDANGTDVIYLEYSVVDKNGTCIPHADNLIQFEVSGQGKIIGVENGDILDLSPHKVNHRKVFKGKCLLLIQSGHEAGEIIIKATSNGLEPVSANIKVK